MGADGQVNVGEPRLQFANRVERGIVVRIGAYKEMIVVVIDGGDIVFHHSADHHMLMPQRHEDGDLFFRAGVGHMRLARGFFRSVNAALQPGPKEDQIQRQIIESADQKRQGGREQTGGHSCHQKLAARMKGSIPLTGIVA